MSARSMIQRFVGSIIDREIAARLPGMVSSRVRSILQSAPESKLTKIGFEWAFTVGIWESWPKAHHGTCKQWLWDYLDVPHGTQGYEWTARSATDLAHQFVAEFGEGADRG